jgi:MFS family permease
MLLTSAAVSRLADGAASIALVLVVIARTHDARLAGLVVAAFTVPTLVSGPVLGAWLDRLRARHLLFAGNQVILAAALTGVVVLAGHTPALVLIGLGLCAGLTTPVLTGGFSSLVPLVVPPASLPRANALDAARYNAGLAGPAIVAAVAGAAGAAAALSAVAAAAGRWPATGSWPAGAPAPAATALVEQHEPVALRVEYPPLAGPAARARAAVQDDGGLAVRAAAGLRVDLVSVTDLEHPLRIRVGCLIKLTYGAGRA